MTFLTSIAVFGAGSLLMAGAAVSVEPTPTPTPSSPPGTARVLTMQEVKDILLEPADFEGPFIVEDSAGTDIAPMTCLERLDYLPQGATSGSRTMTDDMYTVVLSGISSHSSAEEASGVLAAAEFVARGCPEIDIDGMKLKVTVSDGPDVGSDDQFLITLDPGVNKAELFKAELLYERVGNNIGYVGVLSADEPPPVDTSATAQRFHDKLNAASLGEPIPLTDEQAARRLALGATYQGTRSTVTVSTPKPYPTSGSAPAPQGRAIAVTVTVANQGTEVMPKDQITSTASCDGIEAAPIDNAAGGLGTSPPTDIAAGQTVSWDIGYIIDRDACELTVVMTYAMNDHIYFTGPA
ncbi:hypothetical protein Rhe02_60340 [Rhizocola hellebori]|uniref:DUF11 domain-containing protein n=1 Tax=Rhizocola hellebori TaxID=1392758 RepID=A0A8J3QDC7_9ACTN|nr:hypothetical protein [Rhizocola hellebori]GIH07967.1 hypothetical protein Rhe02_60340 [Rhizocola hellebori]